MIPRVDEILSELMEAFERDDLSRADELAVRAAAAHPGLLAWSNYIRAGVLALRGDPSAGLRLLAESDARGGWWSPPLLDDPALAAIWPLDDRNIRARSERRWREAQRRATVSWEVVRPSGKPTAVIISLHGNCPAPADLFASLWAELESCATFLPRSPQLVACAVHDWRDRERAITDVQVVARAARAEYGSEVPLVLVGLGAGGRVAVESVVTGAVLAAGAVAFAPHLRPLDANVLTQSRIRIFPGGTSASTRSCDSFAGGARARGIDCTLHYLAGLGRAFPTHFGPTVIGALETILGEQSIGAGEDALADS